MFDGHVDVVPDELKAVPPWPQDEASVATHQSHRIGRRPAGRAISEIGYASRPMKILKGVPLCATFAWLLPIAQAGGATTALPPNSAPPPVLRGLYKIETLLALDDKARHALGFTKRSLAEVFMGSAKAGTILDVEESVRFEGEELFLRLSSVVRTNPKAKAFSWISCEGHGQVQWKESSLIVPRIISTEAKSGRVDGQDSIRNNCNASLDAQTFHLKLEKGAVSLISTSEAGTVGMVLTPFDHVFDPESREATRRI